MSIDQSKNEFASNMCPPPHSGYLPHYPHFFMPKPPSDFLSFNVEIKDSGIGLVTLVHRMSLITELMARIGSDYQSLLTLTNGEHTHASIARISKNGFYLPPNYRVNDILQNGDKLEAEIISQKPENSCLSKKSINQEKKK